MKMNNKNRCLQFWYHREEFGGISLVHYYQPELAPGWLLPEPDRFEEKFGGLPWGFPVEKWPVCTLCEVSLPLVAQLRHRPKRLDLGKEGRVLFFFLCQDDHCVPESTWHVEILSEEELGQALVRPSKLPVRVLPEVRVLRWMEKTEKLQPDEAWKCWDPKAWDREWFELTEKIEEGLKLGGLPCWNRAPDDFGLSAEFKSGSWRFAAQFEPDIWLPGDGEDDYSIQIMNAGEETGYLFIDPDPVHPKGLFFTQVF
jgi:hypothetical protein